MLRPLIELLSDLMLKNSSQSSQSGSGLASGSVLLGISSIGARSDTGLTSGAIAGITVGLLLSLMLGMAIMIVLVALYLMKRKGKYSTGKEHTLGNTIQSHEEDSYLCNTCTADNITYGIGGDKENGNVVEAGVYEVPLSLKRDTEPTYDLSGSIYATPNVYEYTTLGPNEEMVIRYVCVSFQSLIW